MILNVCVVEPELLVVGVVNDLLYCTLKEKNGSRMVV